MTMVLNGTSGVTTNSGTLISATTVGVGGTTPAASGAGISFPATQSASSDANTLDDYEEGTWTPSLGGTATYTIQLGTYTKIGRQVIANFDISVNTIGTGLTTQFSGLPFTSISGAGPDGMGGPIGYMGATATAVVSAYLRVDRNTTSVYVWSNTAAQSTIAANALFGNGARLTGTVTYITA